jgi:hypothetical protein
MEVQAAEAMVEHPSSSLRLSSTTALLHALAAMVEMVGTVGTAGQKTHIMLAVEEEPDLEEMAVMVGQLQSFMRVSLRMARRQWPEVLQVQLELLVRQRLEVMETKPQPVQQVQPALLEQQVRLYYWPSNSDIIELYGPGTKHRYRTNAQHP